MRVFRLFSNLVGCFRVLEAEQVTKGQSSPELVEPEGVKRPSLLVVTLGRHEAGDLVCLECEAEVRSQVGDASGGLEVVDRLLEGGLAALLEGLVEPLHRAVRVDTINILASNKSGAARWLGSERIDGIDGL